MKIPGIEQSLSTYPLYCATYLYWDHIPSIVQHTCIGIISPLLYNIPVLGSYHLYCATYLYWDHTPLYYATYLYWDHIPFYCATYLYWDHIPSIVQHTCIGIISPLLYNIPVLGSYHLYCATYLYWDHIPLYYATYLYWDHIPFYCATYLYWDHITSIMQHTCIGIISPLFCNISVLGSYPLCCAT